MGIRRTEELILGVDLSNPPRLVGYSRTRRAASWTYQCKSAFSPEGVATLAEEIRHLMNDKGQAESAILGIPASDCVFSLITLPRMKPVLVEKALRMELKRLFPKTMDSSVARYAEWPSELPLPPGQNASSEHVSYIVVSAQETWIVAAEKLGQLAKLKVSAIDPCPAAACRVVSHAYSRSYKDNFGLRVVVVTGSPTYISYGFGQAIWGTRRVAGGLPGIDEEIVPAEVARTIRHVRSSLTLEPKDLVAILGPEAESQRLAAAIQGRTGIPVTTWSDSVSGEYAVALGLCLRGEDQR